MNYLESLYWIHERTKFGIKPGVKRMEWMLDRLNNPQLNIRGIHVGGTNGKGSTVAYIRAALVENGYEVGTFTSPFIETFNERISLNGLPITNDEIVELVEIVKPISEVLEQETELGGATEFEIITTMMFVYFGQIHPVDFVVVEAGLGIKNDSTNVFNPILSVLTSIGLDHTDILGNTYLDIAKDKGAIIRPNILGEHQKENAALAITALIELYEQEIITLDFNKMIDAIESVSWTGRIEQVKENPLIIIDGAHNNESIEALIDTIKNYYDNEKMDVLFSAIKGKPVHGMLNKLEEISNHLYFTEFDFPKALTKDELSEQVNLEHIEFIDDYVSFINNYDGNGLLITGSLYFISEVKSKTEF